ncbi:MAG: hypothetical protein IJ538_04390 [Clostridia bacterium]|nr:hypothetical protein [Clostridia bacterium]
MILLTELKVPVNYSKSDIFKAIEKKYHLFSNEILNLDILKESIDARQKPNVIIKLNVAVDVTCGALKKLKNVDEVKVDHLGIKCEKFNFNGERPMVVGFGPSGMFAALRLALAGFKPIVVEQGKCVDERQKDIDLFWTTGKLNKFSNVQFGEGGAGTYSDGKLASNVSNEHTKKCINEFVLAGAPSEIFYSGTPHIGSDKLKTIVKNIRKKIIANGGDVWFNTKFVDYELKNGKISSVKLNDTQTGEIKIIPVSALILAVGHSAEDTYNLLLTKHVLMKQKPFAMGVRIEQSQEDINLSQFGTNDSNFPAANYKLVQHLENGRSVFTFCMCPGGEVVASSSDDGTIVTNGMSNYARDGKNANSALLVNVDPKDYDEGNVLDGVRFQRKYEKLAFELGGRNYSAPAERVEDFLKGIQNPTKLSTKIEPTYLPKIKIADISKCLPNFVCESLKLSLPLFEKKIKNFANPENLLIGIESRSSAPVQIVRDENGMISDVGIFAVGEGAGYAGGITSSAADGLKIAEKVEKYLIRNNN